MRLKILGFTLIAFLSSAVQADDWSLMSRHGECSSLNDFNERNPLLNGATNLVEMESVLTEKGVQYTLGPLEDGYDDMLILNVPSKEWSLILVKEAVCQNFLEKG